MKCCQVCGANGTVMHCWGKSKMVQSLWKTAVSYIVEHMLTINSVIPLLGIYQTEIKTSVYTKTCMQMIIKSIFMIVPNCKQLKCPQTDELVKILWYIIGH